jgi:hypothetical protein
MPQNFQKRWEVTCSRLEQVTYRIEISLSQEVLWPSGPRIVSESRTRYFSNIDSQYKIWGFHGGDYEDCRLLGYKTPVRTSQETHYVSATEYSRLMLCKNCGIHGCDYEECRLLGYKNPVRTSQETHYVSTTQPSQLMLCKVWGIHGGGYEEYCFRDVALCGSCQEPYGVTSQKTTFCINSEGWR